MRKAMVAGVKPEIDRVLAKKEKGEQTPRKGLGSVRINRQQSRSNHQRNEERYPIYDEDASAAWRNGTHAIKIINVSSNGLEIECDRRADIGEILAVRIGKCSPVDCAVRWIKDGRMGLEFASETQIIVDAGVLRYIVESIAKSLKMSGAQVSGRVGIERREHAERHPFVWLVNIICENEHIVARMRNISATGALLQCETVEGLHRGDAVVMAFGSDERIGGKIAWLSGNAIGLEFDTEYDVKNLIGRKAVTTSAFEQPKAQEEPDGFERMTRYMRSYEAPEAFRPVDDGYGGLTLEELYKTLYPNGKPKEPAAVPEAFDPDAPVEARDNPQAETGSEASESENFNR